MKRFNDVDKSHERIELREANVSHNVDAPRDRHCWSGLQVVGQVTAMRDKEGLEHRDPILLPQRKAWPKPAPYDGPLALGGGKLAALGA